MAGVEGPRSGVPGRVSFRAFAVAGLDASYNCSVMAEGPFLREFTEPGEMNRFFAGARPPTEDVVSITFDARRLSTARTARIHRRPPVNPASAARKPGIERITEWHPTRSAGTGWPEGKPSGLVARRRGRRGGGQTVPAPPTRCEAPASTSRPARAVRRGKDRPLGKGGRPLRTSANTLGRRQELARTTSSTWLIPALSRR
jgi:hypothetical protein